MTKTKLISEVAMSKSRHTPIKRDPFFNGAMKPLDFGDMTEDLMAKTDDDKASKFLSDYMETVDPVAKYKSYFQASGKDTGHILRDVKLMYKRLVLEGKWSEEKLIDAFDTIFSEFIELNTVTMDRVGLKLERKKFGSSNNRRRRRS